MICLQHQINIISVLGLVADIWGVYILFKHALPPSYNLTEDVIKKLGLTNDVWSELVANDMKQRKEIKCANNGWKLVIVGFLLQLASNIFVVTL